MSYLASMGADAPAPLIDVIKIWSLMKKMLVEKLGTYKLPGGVPAIIDGKLFPLLTKTQAIALKRAWDEFGIKLRTELEKQGKSTARVSSLITTFNGEYVQWFLDTDAKFGDQKFEGKYLFAAAVRDLFKVIDKYTVNLSTLGWSAQNIESAYERMLQALDETPGGFLLKYPLIAANAVSKGLPKPPDLFGFVGNLAEIVKWGAIGGGLFMLYWYVLRPSGRRAGGGEA